MTSDPQAFPLQQNGLQREVHNLTGVQQFAIQIDSKCIMWDKRRWEGAAVRADIAHTARTRGSRWAQLSTETSQVQQTAAICAATFAN